MMKFEEMKTLSGDQLSDVVGDWRKELLKLSIDASLQKKAESPHKFKLLRKQIARALTLLKQKQMEGS